MSAYEISGFRFEDETSAREALKEQKAVAKIRASINMEDPAAVLRVYTQAIAQDLFHTKVGLAFLQECQDKMATSTSVDATKVPPIKFSAIDPDDEPEPQKKDPKKAIIQPTQASKPTTPLPPIKHNIEYKTGAHTRRFDMPGAKPARPVSKTEESDSAQDRAERVRSNMTRLTENRNEKKLMEEIIRLRRWNSILLVLCIAFAIAMFGMFIINSTVNNPSILNYEQQIIDKYAAWDQELTAREQVLKRAQ